MGREEEENTVEGKMKEEQEISTGGGKEERSRKIKMIN